MAHYQMNLVITGFMWLIYISLQIVWQVFIIKQKKNSKRILSFYSFIIISFQTFLLFFKNLLFAWHLYLKVLLWGAQKKNKWKHTANICLYRTFAKKKGVAKKNVTYCRKYDIFGTLCICLLQILFFTCKMATAIQMLSMTCIKKKETKNQLKNKKIRKKKNSCARSFQIKQQ